jgi:F-type H+-transporting ATPase subunit delta
MNSQAVQSYASAFFEIAQENGKNGTFADNAESLVSAFKDPEVVAFFKSPIYSVEEKELVVNKALEGKVDPLLGGFIKLLAKNGRLNLFPSIMEEFKDAASGGKGAKKGEVFSASDLTDAEKKSIQQAIEKKLNMPVSLDFKTKPELMGGIEARVGSFMIEDSLKSDLDKLNDSLKRSSH